MEEGGQLEVNYTRYFLKQLSRLPKHIIEQARQREATFKFHPFDPRLETHKLHGKEKEVWAFSVTRSYRIKFIFLTPSHVLFLEIGTHDIYS